MQEWFTTIMFKVHIGWMLVVCTGACAWSPILSCHAWATPTGIYLLKFNNRNTRTRCKICFKFNKKDTRMTPGVALVSLLLTLNIFTPRPSVSIVNFEHIIPGWVPTSKSDLDDKWNKILCEQLHIVKKEILGKWSWTVRKIWGRFVSSHWLISRAICCRVDLLSYKVLEPKKIQTWTFSLFWGFRKINNTDNLWLVH